MLLESQGEKMPTYRVEVELKNPPKPEEIRSRLYFLEGADLTLEEVELLTHEVLCDPVTEQSRIFPDGTRPTDNSSCIEVTMLPGVTDSAAENLVRAAMVLRVISLEQAATGERIVLKSNYSETELQKLANSVYSNPVVQRSSINSSITPPFVHAEKSASPARAQRGIEVNTDIEMIEIRGADDARLLEISRERRLALDLTEMQAVQVYYQKEAREAADVELEMIAQTWSEHCVHKTFRAKIEGSDGSSVNGLLKTYIVAANAKINKSWVRSAIKDNAGMIEFDDEFDLAFKVETHNHPSALEPFGGANTGAGGVIRDVLAVGARPIANTDILCFGPLERQNVPEGVLPPQRVFDGVVHGIEDYGNKMGIPTVNGAIFYHEGYTANPLVFAGCLGILPASERNANPLKAKPGDLIIALGGRTGRDGLRGATFSSLEMDTSTAEIAGASVQIGNPITEKQVQEVILKAKAENLYSALTDCGAGGFSSAVGEMSEGLGATVQLERALLKYPGLQPWEIWLSEAQERMVLGVPKENWARLEKICESQNVEAFVLGEFNDSGRLELRYFDTLVGQLALEILHDGIPQKTLQADVPKRSATVGAHGNAPTQDTDLTKSLLELLAHPNIKSKEPVIRRYDHEVKGGTAVKPLVGAANHGPSDAAVLVPNPSSLKTIIRGVSLSNGICPQYGELEPYAMAWAAVDEAVRNAVAVGADPDRIAILDNFCWGNPTLPDRLGGLLETTRGCYDAALAYGTPFISGKDSLYNEYTDESGAKHAIPGTLLISAVGIVPDVQKTVTMDFKKADNLIYVLGETRDELGASHYAKIRQLEGGVVPQPVANPLERYRKLHIAIQNGWVQACHDLSEGGFSVALAEMCIAGRLGANVLIEKKTCWDQIEADTFLFSESLGRLILEVAPEHQNQIDDLFGNGVCDYLGVVTENPDVIFEYYGAVMLKTNVNTLESAWRGELAPNPVRNARVSKPVARVTAVTEKPVMILHANGSNRDRDAALAVKLSGGNPEIVHINQLLDNERKLEDYAMLIVPGGFSYGDDLGAGVLWALDLQARFHESLEAFVKSGQPVLGICNGFQTLVKAGILPGDNLETRSSTLTFNQSGHFECRWVTLEVNQNSSSIFLQGLDDVIDCPVAHGEGRFLVSDDATLEHLKTNNLIALTYAANVYPANPNGSISSIAGISNAAGNVLGLMPHPENHIFDWQHPRVHRGEHGASGLVLFQNGLKNA
jgi:phosphoribosylformylglycinamidine synthase II/phosphoribosylformylglycinamidine synthase I